MRDVPLLTQAPGCPVFRGAGSGADTVCRSCGRSRLLTNVSAESVFDVRIKCGTCGAIATMPEFPAGRGLYAVRRHSH
jgi:hypothetical protein